MTTQAEKALSFAKLHVKGDPIIIFNVWDAGTAMAVADIGAKAVATGSYAVATANGYDDGEDVSLDLVLENLQRISSSVDLPVSLDFEGGYAVEPDQLRRNIGRVMNEGAIGINFEDRVVKGEGLYSIDDQCERISAIREVADQSEIPLFINARSDVVLPLNTAEHNKDHLSELIERAVAYAEAGASGFFAPGLVNPDFIGKLCDASPLPVNILVWPGVPSSAHRADRDFARISYGGGTYRVTMEAFRNAGRKALEWRESENAA